MRRMKLEVCFGGGKVSTSISNATHLVVMSLPGLNVDFDTIVKRYSALYLYPSICCFQVLNLVVGSACLPQPIDNFGNLEQLLA